MFSLLARRSGLVCMALSSHFFTRRVGRGDKKRNFQEPWGGVWCRVGLHPGWWWCTVECGVTAEGCTQVTRIEAEGAGPHGEPRGSSQVWLIERA